MAESGFYSGAQMNGWMDGWMDGGWLDATHMFYFVLAVIHNQVCLILFFCFHTV